MALTVALAAAAFAAGGVAPARAVQSAERVSLPDPSTGAAEGNGESVEVSVSADGRYAAFASVASNLVPGDTNGQRDIFVRDRRLGTTERVSVPDAPTAGGQTQANGASSWSGLSDDGCRVVFSSYAANLTPGDNNNARDVYVRDRCAGRTIRVSVPANPGPLCIPGESPLATISGDGRLVAFASFATNLLATCTPWFQSHVYVRDLESATTELADRGLGGALANGWSWGASLSRDGRRVAFASTADNLVAGDSNGRPDAFVRDRQSGVVERVSVSSAGTQGNAESVSSFSGKSRLVSDDGRYVVFRSAASNLVPGDTNGAWDVFVRDRLSGTTERVNTSDSGAQQSGGAEVGQISGDGRYVSFQSHATNFDPRDTDPDWDVYVKDRVSGAVELVSVNAGGESTNGSLDDPVLSPDGRFVAWADYGSNMVAGDSNGVPDAIVVDRRPGGAPTPPDLAVSLSANGPVQVGRQAAYTIVVRNPGGTDAAGPATATAGLPVGLTLASAAGSGWSCVATTCSLPGPIPAGGAAPPITLTVGVTAAAVPSVTTTARVACACGDANPSNDAAAQTSAVGAADTISVSLAGPTSYALSERGIDSGDVVVTKNPDASVRDVSATVTVAGVHGAPATVSLRVQGFLGLCFGRLTISDPGAGVDSLRTELFFAPVRALSNPNGASASQAGLQVRTLPWGLYRVDWTVRDNG